MRYSKMDYKQIQNKLEQKIIDQYCANTTWKVICYNRECYFKNYDWMYQYIIVTINKDSISSPVALGDINIYPWQDSFSSVAIQILRGARHDL